MMNPAKILYSLLLIALATACCRKATEQVSIVHTTVDSTAYIETVRIDTIAIAGDTITQQIYIECDSTTMLPKPIYITKYSDRGHSIVTINDKGKLTATSMCDSLTKIIASKDRALMYYRYNNTDTNKTKVIHVKYIPKIFKIAFAIAMAIILFSTIKILSKWQRKTILPWL